MHCLTTRGQWAVDLPQCTIPLPGGRRQWNSCNTLPHCLGAVASGSPAMQRPEGGRNLLQGLWGRQLRPRTGHTRDRESSPGAWSEHPYGPTERRHCLRTGHTGLRGTGSPAQGVVGVSFRAHGEAASSKNRAHRPGRTGGPAQGMVGVSFWAHGEAALSKNQAHQPGRDRKCNPGCGRSILWGPWGGSAVQKPGTAAWGDGESSPGDGRSILRGLWGVSCV